MKFFANWDWRHWLLSHFVWVVAITVALVIGHTAIAEHDARVVADAAIKTSQATITGLQQQITATNTAAAQKTQTIVKIVHDAQTPAQQLAAIPQLADVQLNARPVSGLPDAVTVDLAPLVQELGQCKQDAVQLQACQSDLKNETAIAAQKDVQIAALKKKPAFWKRVKKTLELIGICVGIGAAVGAHI
jgi:hypothetical protein